MSGKWSSTKAILEMNTQQGIQEILDEIGSIYKAVPVEVLQLMREYPELRHAYRRYSVAKDLYIKYNNELHEKWSGITLLQSWFNKAYHRHRARMVIANELTVRRWEEYEVVLKLVQDY